MPHGSTRVLRRCLLLTFSFAGVEAAAGLWTGSLALVSDAGHMVTDSAGLALALLAAWVAERRPSHRYTYGLGRAEVVAAVANGLLMCGIVAWIVFEAARRLGEPRAVDGAAAMGVAAVGLAVNALVARVLLHGERTLNTRAALLHVLGDLLGSLVALVSGAVILATGWTPVDPILSLFICALILVSAVRILGEGLHILLEGVPFGVSTEEVGRALAAAEGVVAVHDLHIWQLGSRGAALSAHVVLQDPARWEEVLGRLRALLRERFEVDHATLQPECPPVPVQVRLADEGGA